MQMNEIAQRCDDLAKQIGPKACISVGYLSGGDARFYANIYPNGVGGVQAKHFYASSWTAIFEQVAESIGLMSSEMEDAMARRMVDIYFSKGSIAKSDLRREFGPLVEEVGLKAIAKLNEALDPKTPIILMDL